MRNIGLFLILYLIIPFGLADETIESEIDDTVESEIDETIESEIDDTVESEIDDQKSMTRLNQKL
jgi:hypothetical protein